MTKTVSAVLAALLILLSLAGCRGNASEHNDKTPEAVTTEASFTADANATAKPTEEPAASAAPVLIYDDAAWYSPLQRSSSPAKVLNIATGEVLVACPDPLCTHSEGSDTCFFNRYQDETVVYSAEYLNGHIYFVAEKSTEDGSIQKLYDFDINANRIDEIYTYPYIQSTATLYKNSSTLFFAAVTEGAADDSFENMKVSLFAYDPAARSTKLIDDNALYAIGAGGANFLDDYYIRDDGASVDEDGEHYWYRRCFYDGSSEDAFDSLPDGTPFSPIGWALKQNGIFANTWGEGGLYIIEDGIRLDFPTDSATTAPVRYKDDFYFQTRGSEFVKLGKDPYTGADHNGYTYDNELYVMNKDGSYKHYSIDCEYHFITTAVYENVLIGMIKYRIPSPGKCMMGGDSDTYILPDFIRINLETGETTVYDMSRRSRFEVESFISSVTLNED